MIMTMENDPNRSETVIFLHIPKAAGSTIQNIIDREYSRYPSGSVYLFDGSDLERTISKFKDMTENERNKIKILKGHMNYGFHKYFKNKCKYFTLLRDPVDRVISDFYYILEQPSHSRYQRVMKEKMDLEDYLRSKMSVAMDNAQTRLLAGYLSGVGDVNEGDIPFGECNTSMLDDAKMNLRNGFAVVGLTERFDETLLMLQRTFGWRTPFYTKANVTKKRPRKKEVSEESLELITEYNHLDIQLYDYAATLFQEKIDSLGEEFQEDLIKYKKRNLKYQKLGKISEPLFLQLYKRT